MPVKKKTKKAEAAPQACASGDPTTCFLSIVTIPVCDFPQRYSSLHQQIDEDFVWQRGLPMADAYLEEHAEAEANGASPEQPAPTDAIDEHHANQRAEAGTDVVDTG